jgi:hypothetical protein
LSGQRLGTKPNKLSLQPDSTPGGVRQRTPNTGFEASSDWRVIVGRQPHPTQQYIYISSC